MSSGEWLAKPGTVGKVNPPDHIRILDDDGQRRRAPGTIGTVFLKAPAASRFEYYKAPEKTAGAYRGDYFTLGDVGYVDDDGYLFLTDRSAHLIISGGVNIYPAEVEAVLLGHPAVGDVGVVGVPDDEWGEIVVAVVELHAGVEPSPELGDELVEWCRGPHRALQVSPPRRVRRSSCPGTTTASSTSTSCENNSAAEQPSEREDERQMGICDGRVVIVTGSGRGIGREHALAYAAEGAKVVVNDLGGDMHGDGGSLSPAMEVVEEIKAMGGEAVADGENVADFEGAGRMVQRAIDTFGRARHRRQQRRDPARPHAHQHGRVRVGRGDQRAPQGHVRPDAARRRLLARADEGRQPGRAVAS